MGGGRGCVSFVCASDRGCVSFFCANERTVVAVLLDVEMDRGDGGLFKGVRYNVSGVLRVFDDDPEEVVLLMGQRWMDICRGEGGEG